MYAFADSAYADTLLEHARQLYDFGYNVRETYHHKIPDAEEFYPYVSESWNYKVNEVVELTTRG